MGGMTCAEFAQEVVDTCADAVEVIECTVLLYDQPVIKFRVGLTDRSYIDVFYNADTSKVSFAWIAGGQRVFGIDNTRGWHVHPMCSPRRHRPHPPITFRKFLEEVERQIQCSRP